MNDKHEPPADGNAGDSDVGGSQHDAAQDTAASHGREFESPHQRLSDDPDLAAFGRAAKAFLVPFLASFAIAYVGSARGVDWLHFVGLGGVGLSMLGLLVWLIS